MTTYKEEYNQFFTAPAGSHLIEWINESITRCHEKAEAEPDKATQHVLTAKGYRDVLTHINSKIGVTVKK